jgi:DNA-binding transcriptional LysR family regulator
MIAVRIGPDMRMAVVGAPSYFDKRAIPKKPQDLTEHNCINLRMPTYGSLYAWEFEKGKRELKVRVDGQLVVNTMKQRLDAALAGVGLAHMVEDVAELYVAEGALVRVLEDWCAPFSGYHLYYPGTGRGGAHRRRERRRARLRRAGRRLLDTIPPGMAAAA